MNIDFTSVRNSNERAVYEAVNANAAAHPGLAHDAELLADVACVALNRLQPRYIRHAVDFAFYLTEKERQQTERQVGEAVDYAFGFVQARVAMRARG
ncbi:MAG TPA: late competence development ComFB family protein [Rubrivivax sp.]|nr:late competence development ComFB family protein [Burkholderiales bacterium]HNT38753.1 late competence development ComFB family protein [Rubrivivax sp.]